MTDVGQFLFESFRDWINAQLPSAVLIRRRPNAPPPKGHYLVFDDGLSLEQVGRASRGYRSPTDFQSVVQDWNGSVALWEIGARSALLSQLIQNLDLQASQEYFFGLGITVRIPGAILPIPSLEDVDWIEQFRVEIPVGVATGQTDEALVSIDTVDLVNQITTTEA